MYVLQNRCHEDEFDPLQISFDTVHVDSTLKVFSDGYHWAFPSLYEQSGFLRIRAGAGGYDSSCEEECEGSLPYDLLQKRAEIRWYSQMLLFEDDLADFGYVMMECRCVEIVRSVESVESHGGLLLHSAAAVSSDRSSLCVCD